MTYPHPMDICEAEDRECDGLDFICDTCDCEFFVKDYRGEWDHPPGVPVCPECKEKEDE